MAAKLLDGNETSAEIRAGIKAQLEKRREAGTFLKTPNTHGVPIYTGPIGPPCLAVVLCTEDPASSLYVKRKQDACKEVGITSYLVRPFEGGIENWTRPKDHLLATIDYLNRDSSVHGVLVQLPLPKGIDQYEVFDRIDPLKDVDVFNPVNVGLLLQGRPRFNPCTPAGIQELLTRHGIEIAGKKVCIINRSDVVGKPLHAMLIQNHDQANATVTLCHDRTPPSRLREACLVSDIIVVAVGKPGFLTADMVPAGAVVVDVGINRVEGSKKIVGDSDFENVSKVAGWITPVPGGVGPMTVTMLLQNTLMAQSYQFYARHEKS